MDASSITPAATNLVSGTWRIEGSRAALTADTVRCSINLAAGPHDIELAAPGAGSAVSLWQLRQLEDLPLREAYVRDHDLFASYEPVASFPFDTDIYWTRLEPKHYPATSLALQMIVSVHTDQLDTHPELHAVTTNEQPDIELVPSDQGCIMRTPLAGELHLIEFATQVDSPEFALVGGGRVQHLSRQLFGHFLEKGVIRRARLFAAVVPADATSSQVEQLCHQFADSPWPLTA